jgi:hypothetical protein
MLTYMPCQTCSRLWAEYGVTFTKLEGGAADLNAILEATKARQNAGEAIRVHENEVHLPPT